MSPRTAIVVLGCRVEPTGEPSAALARRTAWAAAAWAAGLGDVIVPAGGRAWPVGDGVAARHTVEADVVAGELCALGVDADAILPERLSLTTAENALFTGDKLRRLGIARALIATCEWHMPRALACFATVGFEALPVRAPAPPAALAMRVSRAVRERISTALDRARLRGIERLRARGVPHPYDGLPRAEVRS